MAVKIIQASNMSIQYKSYGLSAIQIMHRFLVKFWNEGGILKAIQTRKYFDCPWLSKLETKKPFIFLVNLLMVLVTLKVFHTNPNFESFSFILAIKKYKTGNHCLELFLHVIKRHKRDSATFFALPNDKVSQQ